MNVQAVLFENSDKMPEGLYIELQNKLKIDFDNRQKEEKVNVLIIDKAIPRKILMKKQDLVIQIINSSIGWEDREKVLVDIVQMCYHELKSFTELKRLPLMKDNPRWVRQADCIRLLREKLSIDVSQNNFINENVSVHHL